MKSFRVDCILVSVHKKVNDYVITIYDNLKFPQNNGKIGR
ncbi:hypothetical protein SAMN04487995_3315 [Dyadobacter koreensis]|uniref:Uncharacterized protein n=1 Tax=Dyadobacter koreensis TaxID=408657 RepID=A0A1H6W4L0_9BACT|nr:hypothetical protein SAMN04487995_3315 [Dyadobacter koreensis]